MTKRTKASIKKEAHDTLTDNIQEFQVVPVNRSSRRYIDALFRDAKKSIKASEAFLQKTDLSRGNKIRQVKKNE